MDNTIKDKQQEGDKNLNLEKIEKNNTTKTWIRSGLFYGLFMLISMEIIFPLIENKEISQKRILIGVPIWLICGLAWGLIMKWWMKKQAKINKEYNELE